MRSAKKNGRQSIGKSRGGWSTKIHLVAANDRLAVNFKLSPGNAHDAAEGRELLKRLTGRFTGACVLMDKAYEGDETRQLVLDLGFEAVVPPKSNRLQQRDLRLIIKEMAHQTVLRQNTPLPFLYF